MISDSCHSGRVARFPLIVTPPTIIGDNALEWLAATCSHVPNKGEQMVRYYKHLGLWEVKPRPPPEATGPPETPEYHLDYSTSQLPVSDKWLYVDPEYPETFPS